MCNVYVSIAILPLNNTDLLFPQAQLFTIMTLERHGHYDGGHLASRTVFVLRSTIFVVVERTTFMYVCIQTATLAGIH